MHILKVLWFYFAVVILDISVFASLPDVSGVIGASINENNIIHAIHVSVDGNDLNSGTELSPLRTINAAAGRAGINQLNHEGTHIMIHPGTYRETVNNLMNYPVTGSIGVPIIFEPAEPNTVVISGSEVYTGWNLAGTDIYTHNWPYDWGLYVDISTLTGYEKQVFIDYPVLRRREMFFVDGQLLTQVLSYSEMQSQQRSFYVDEAADTVYIHLWPGANANTALVEAAIRMYCFRASKNREIVVRGLTFQHATNVIFGNGAVSFETCKDILFESNTIQWNNGIGWSVKGGNTTTSPTVYYCCERITARRNVANYNGIAGTETLITRNTLFEDNVTSYNNWRGNMGTLTWGWTGTRFYRMHKAIIRRHTSYGNYARGIWFDYDASNVVLEDSSLCHNADGLKFEVAQGPVLVKDCTLSDNASTGILYHVSNNVTIQGCTLGGNGSSQLYVDGGQVSRYLSDWENEYPSGYLEVGNLNFTENIIGASGSQLLANSITFEHFLATFNSDYNYWYHTINPNSFKVGIFYNFAGWKSLTGQDVNSFFSSSAPVPAFCGDRGTAYFSSDINIDCQTNSLDLAALSRVWMQNTASNLMARNYIMDAWQDTSFSTDGNPNSASGGTITNFTNSIYLSGGGRAVSLFQFDLGAIKSGLAISSATLFVRANEYRHNGSTAVGGMVHGWKFHRMLVPWSEASTYNSLNTLRAGIEYDAAPFTTYIHDGNEGPGFKYIPGFETAVTNWVNKTWNNYGFIIISYAPTGSTAFNNVSFRSRDFVQWQNENPLMLITASDYPICGEAPARWNEDINHDCVVDIKDMYVLAMNWLASSI